RRCSPARQTVTERLWLAPSRSSSLVRSAPRAMVVRAGFEPDRVARVWARGQKTGMVGSGYLLGDGLVLTSKHVVDHGKGGACEVMLLGLNEELPAVVVWRGGGRCDAALLQVGERRGGPDPAKWLGRIGGTERVACRALGFPFAQANEKGTVRDTEDLTGEI